MDNYEVIVQKTVRDLFKGTPLTQIKKFKTSKEKEIEKKDEELRNLILEMYPTLVNSISTLEQISSSLKDLQEIRVNFSEKVKNIEYCLLGTNVDYENIHNSFNINQEEVLLNNNNENSFSLNECWIILEEEKDYKEILLRLSKVKSNSFSLKKYNTNEECDLLLSQLLEKVMKKFVMSNSSKNNNIGIYIRGIFGVFYLVTDIDKLNLSEFYIKLETEETLNEAYNKLFNFFSQEERENSYALAWNRTIKLMFKLFILKLSINIKSLSEVSTKTNTTDSIFSTYSICKEVILLLSKLSEEEILSDNEFENSIEMYDDKLPMDYNMINVLKEIKLILNIDYCEIQIKVFTKEKCSEVSNKFLKFVKQEIQNNFMISIVSPIDLINFWKEVFCKSNNINSEFEEENVPELIIGYNTLFNFLFIDLALHQTEKSLKEEFEKISYKNFCNNAGNFKPQIKDILNEVVDGKFQNTSFTNKLFSLYEDIVFNFLASNQIYNLPNFTNFLASIFLDKSIIKYFKKIERCSDILQKLAEKYSINLIESVKIYTNTLKENLITENYLDEDCYSESKHTETLMNICRWIKNNINVSNLELNEQEFSRVSLYNKCLGIILEAYLTFIKELGNEDISNKKIYEDLKILYCVLKEHQTDGNMDNLLAEVQSILPNENIEIETNCWMYNEINSIFTDNEGNANLVINKTNKEYKFYLENVIDHIATQYGIPFPPRLNVFMLSKTKHNKSSSSSGNSTSKLLELRIDDNYLSLKPQNKLENPKGKIEEREQLKTPPLNRDTKDNRELDYLKDYLGYFGGKLKENLNTFTGYINNADKK